MSKDTTFEDAASSNWSDPGNWSNGLPVNGDNVTVTYFGYDDLAALTSLASLKIDMPGTDDSYDPTDELELPVTAPNLTIATITSANPASLEADSQISKAPVMVSVGNLADTGGVFGAVGAGAVFLDQSAVDQSNYYIVLLGGFAEFWATPASTSIFDFSHLAAMESLTPNVVAGTIALKNPAASNAAQILHVGNGDVLELPGTLVKNGFIGSASMSFTTNVGSYAFTNVTYEPETANGFTATVNGYNASFDASTGLVAITFTAGPAVGGAVAAQKTGDESSIAPFAGVTITDAYPDQTETVTVSLSAVANGALYNLGAGTYNAATGVYSVTGTTQSISAAVDALRFAPTAHQVAPGQSVTTVFTISVTDTVGVTETNNTTSVIASNQAKLAALVSFNSTDGANPDSSVIMDSAGDLFGTTSMGGAGGDGTVFEVARTASGYASAPVALVTFNGANGQYPEEGLFADSAGNLYGTTIDGGPNIDGAPNPNGEVFEVAKLASGYSSTPTPIVAFNGLDGAGPQSILATDAAGDIFGGTNSGFEPYNTFGTVFEIKSTAGAYSSAPLQLGDFNGDNGALPIGQLLIDSAGNIFGTTYGYNYTPTGDPYGSVFEIAKTANGYAAPVTLASFDSTDGANPLGSLVEDAKGDLFGAAARGGVNGDGTVFEIVNGPNGYASTPVVLANFTGANGQNPFGGLIADAGGNLYGATYRGGASSYGEVFEIVKTGSLYGSITVLYSFNGQNGANPFGSLSADAAGDLLGTTFSGGTYGYGTVFSLSNVGFQVATGNGTGEDGYIVGATVSYENGSGTPATTDANGSFSLTGGSGPIKLTGGTDSATGLAFTGTLTAPSGFSILSPLTTLVEDVVEAGGDSSAAGISTAESEVATALNLPAVDLSSYDAEGALLAAPANSPALSTAAQIFGASNDLESLERIIDAAGGSSVAALAAIAQELAAGNSVDLTNPSKLINNAGLTADAAAAVADIANTTENAVAAQLQAAGTPGAVFDYITGGAIALQSDAVTALRNAAGEGGGAAFTQAASSFDSSISKILAAGDQTAAGNAPCFCAGTRILNAAGALVRVEDLREGDEVETYNGQAARIVWIGRRTVALRRHRRPDAVQPILISAGALGRGLPWRDLVVSPDHALYLQGHLIPAKALTNGFSIRQLNRETVTYYHIELPEHGVLFAEGAGAESYLETGNRATFENGGDALTLHPDFAQKFREQGGYAPFAESGHVVETVRQDILDRAGIETTADPNLRIRYETGGAIIATRSAIPGDIFADPRDRRRLGVKIARLRVDGHDLPLNHPALTEGWHDPEPDGRWTDGRAKIPMGLLGGSSNLQVSMAAALRYPMDGVRPAKRLGRAV